MVLNPGATTTTLWAGARDTTGVGPIPGPGTNRFPDAVPYADVHAFTHGAARNANTYGISDAGFSDAGSVPTGESASGITLSV